MTNPATLQRPSIPAATYRLQFRREFTFEAAARLAGYFSDLGISHIYASPIFKATPGSAHGYDICDQNELNPELGSRERFNEFSSALKTSGLGLLLDFVPNHMGIGEPSNRWWMDVLANGPSSPYAEYFDIDWRPLMEGLRNKVLLPILGDQYGRVLEKGELQLRYDAGVFTLHYYEATLPLDPASTRGLIQAALDQIRGEAAPETLQEMESILTALEHLPKSTDQRREKVAERAREAEIIKRRLTMISESDPVVQAALLRKVGELQAPGDESSYDALDKLLNAQNYRLAYWRVAGEEINYRRFFDINTLAAIRMERPEVFEAAHELVFQLLKEDSASGLRIDHVDGLYDPAQYLELLQRRYGELFPDAKSQCPLYLLVEKILAQEEELRTEWPVHGTTGYEFVNQAIEALVDESAGKTMTDTYERFTGLKDRFSDIAYRCKLLVMRSAMASEINVLGHMLNRISETSRWYRDFTRNALTAAVRELIACFPVYRTYLRPNAPTSENARKVIRRALDQARRRNPALERSVFDFLSEVLAPTAGNPHAVAEELRQEFVMKFQQCSGPITAKGVEDTAFYIYNRLVALNEVGGEPGIFGSTPEKFHAQQAARLAQFPHSMVATSTHDTKRSEDVRARIAALSEFPREWAQAVRRWKILNRKFKREIDGEQAPDANEEYLLYQTIVGSWPLEPLQDDSRQEYRKRIEQYMEKALREAKVNSSWIEPNQGWDEATGAFVAAILDASTGRRFLESLAAFAAPIAQYGAVNSLSQLLLKATVPGVPDFYQGNEIWDFSLVDPDNRRPVDYGKRQQMLASLGENPDPAELLEQWRDGRIKLFTTQRLLKLRGKHPALFQSGAYNPVPLTGAFATCCLAFTRELGGERLLVAAPRLASRVGFPPVAEKWRDTALSAPGRWRNVFTGEELSGESLRVSDVLRVFPVAAFVGL